MATIRELQEQYEGLTERLEVEPEETIDPSCLLSFDYEYAG